MSWKLLLGNYCDNPHSQFPHNCSVSSSKDKYDAFGGHHRLWHVSIGQFVVEWLFCHHAGKGVGGK